MVPTVAVEMLLHPLENLQIKSLVAQHPYDTHAFFRSHVERWYAIFF